MAVDFRCEKCGKLLSVDSQPGSEVRCPHCKKKLQVPEGLASLPTPQIPGQPPQQPQSSPPPPPVPEPDQTHANHHPDEDPIMNTMASLMPWVLSVFFHLGLALIMLFVVMIVQQTMPEDVTVPDAVISEELTELDVGQTRRLQDISRKKTKSKSYSKRETAIQSDAAKTKKRVRLIGAGQTASSDESFSNLKTASRSGPKSSFYGKGGNAYHVVYVIDRSGSMATVFPFVRQQILISIGRLKKTQDFHVILFSESQTMENPPRRLVSATRKNKISVVKFLEGVKPMGSTTALPALKRAFTVLQKASSRRSGKLIYLLTDGDFGGIGGGSRYKGKAGNDAVIQWLRDHNPNGRIHINTYLMGGDPKADEVMKTIAQENGGVFKRISDDE